MDGNCVAVMPQRSKYTQMIDPTTPDISDGSAKPSIPARLRKYIVAGILTVIPVYVTWWVLQFLVKLLVGFGAPPIVHLAEAIQPRAPGIAAWLHNDFFQSMLAVVVILAGLLLVGWITTLVVGRKLMAAFDAIINRIPLAHQIYGGAKKLVTSFQEKPEGVQRVVLIDFPSPEMKTVGLVTRTLIDSDTGDTLAAVYVPTTPNPTSGYLEIVPIHKVTSTNWTVDEAMNFIVSGGAVAPATMNYSKGVETPENHHDDEPAPEE